MRIHHRVTELLTEYGPAATWEQVKRGLAESGLDCTHDTYYRNHRKMYPPTAANSTGHPTEPEAAPVDGPPRLLPIAADLGEDRLRILIKFACAVEVVGGIGKARQYLDVLEQMGKIA